MFGLPGDGFTDLSLSGILSLPWSPLSSLPPDVEVPLPLLFGAILVVSGLAFWELAAGSPVAEPWPLGPPVWAEAAVVISAKQAAKPIAAADSCKCHSIQQFALTDRERHDRNAIGAQLLGYELPVKMSVRVSVYC